MAKKILNEAIAESRRQDEEQFVAAEEQKQEAMHEGEQAAKQAVENGVYIQFMDEGSLVTGELGLAWSIGWNGQVVTDANKANASKDLI